MEPSKRSNRQNHISHNAIAGYISGSGEQISVAIQPASNAIVSGSGYYYVGLDALFTPITIATVGNTGMFTHLASPKMYPNYTGYNSEDINAKVLNPYKSDNFSIYNSLSGSGNQIVNTVALKMPMLFAGWGYDRNHKPVPGKDGIFISDYQNKPAEWKVGPLDSRWDDRRGVWTVGDQVDVVRLEKLGDGTYNVYRPDSSQVIDSGVSPDKTIGLEYTTVCSGEQLYAYDLRDQIGVYSVLTRPVRGVRVLTDVKCVNNIMYMQYAYIGTQFVAAGYILETSGNKVTAVPTSDQCSDLNTQPYLVSVPLYP